MARVHVALLGLDRLAAPPAGLAALDANLAIVTIAVVIPAPPVVVDADVLLRNIDYDVRKGYPPALLAPPTGVRIFAAEEVRQEVLRHLPEIAVRRQVEHDVIASTWERLVARRIRFVTLCSNVVDDPRLQHVDAKDLPSARLACVLAPAVLATDNRKHFRSLVTSSTKTDEVALDLFRLGQMDAGARGVLLVPGLAAVGLTQGARRVAALVGRDTAVLLGLALAGATALAVSGDRACIAHDRLMQLGHEVGPALGDYVGRAQEASDRVRAFAVSAAERPCASGLIARRLLASYSTMTTREIADSLRDAGFVFDATCSYATATRAWLVSQPCFIEQARGHWSFGAYSNASLAMSRS